ncbi:hypothetical protein F7093_20750, partial [Dickeya dianthicola]|nr:hypothetical protein [Dickeya dianthicola]
VRAARDALPARHGLSPRPCGSPGRGARLSIVLTPEKPKPQKHARRRFLVSLVRNAAVTAHAIFGR